MSDHHVLAHWQNTLRQVLSDYVNGNFLRVRVKWAFPFAWGVSAYAVDYALRKLLYAVYPLASHYKTPALTAYLNQFDSWRLVDGDPEMALLAALTQGYLLLSELVRQQPDVRTDTVHMEREFEDSTYRHMDPAYFSPVVRLAHFIRKQMAPHLSLAAIHGSIGDLNYARGYSDLDTWLVLDEATVTNAARLRQFARKCYRSLADLYRFDPLQHHGHMIATAIDWQWYSENWLPLDTFRHACRLIPDKMDLEIRVRDSALDARHGFEELQELMYLRHAGRWQPETAFELKDYLSILMLAPALYLQAKGLYVAKQDSFQLARDHLPHANWDAMRYATQARSAWPYYRSHLMETVRPPNVFWVDRLQRRQVRKAWQSTVASFPVACLSSAAELTQQMADDVERSTARFRVLKQVCTDADPPLFVVNHPLVREARDYAETRERYLASAQQQRAVLAVYQYGNITYPGLSDLDLLLCVSETVEPIASTRLAVETLGPLDQSLMLHSPMIIPASQTPYLHEFLIDTTLEKIWGTNDVLAGLPAIGSLAKAYAQMARLFEMLFSYRLWTSEVLIQQTLDARWAIPSLKSVVYSCDMLASVSGVTWPWAAEYRAAIQELRANWFLEESQSRQNAALRAVFRLGLDVIVRLMGEFDNFVRRGGWLTDPGPRPAAAVPLPLLNAAVTFDEQLLSDVPHVIARPQQINLPSTFSHFLNNYFQAFGTWNDRDRTPAGQTEFEAYLRERIKRIGQQMRFLKRHDMNFGGYLPGQLEQLLSDTHHGRAE
jgi:hypothetical protein